MTPRPRPRPRPSGSGAGRDDRGSAVVELLPLTVVMFAFVALIVFVGRVNVASAHVEGAARSAARSMTLAPDPGAPGAAADAEAQARELVDAGSSMCTSMGFAPTVTDTAVTVEITCVVDLSSAALIQVPGSMTVDASATEVIDRYRETSDESGLAARLAIGGVERVGGGGSAGG